MKLVDYQQGQTVILDPTQEIASPGRKMSRKGKTISKEPVRASIKGNVYKVEIELFDRGPNGQIRTMEVDIKRLLVLEDKSA